MNNKLKKHFIKVDIENGIKPLPLFFFLYIAVCHFRKNFSI